MKLSLRAYNQLIDTLIEKGNTNEALEHCQHILRDFPRYLETNRLLGKVYLEIKDLLNASKVFQYILSAVPDDFTSNVGMSIVYDERNETDLAIWHMERAFEVQPSNAAIQSELQRFYVRRDGIGPPRIRMTRSALAQMYVQGELYPQAISEIRSVLKEDPSRIDMQVLLARASFRNGEIVETSEICLQILTQYPYCFDANRIMVELLSKTPNLRNKKINDYLERVINLDPYAQFAANSVFQSYLIKDDSIVLEQWDDKSLTSARNLSPIKLQEQVSISNKEQYEILNLEGTLRVFLCHSSDDKPAVRELYNRLKIEGNLKIDPWLDEEKLDPGDEWDLEIRKAVRATHLVIVCLSRNSITKEGYIQKEIREALDVAQEKPPGTVYIIPLRLEDCNVPERLKGYHWLNYYEERAYERLMKSLMKRARELGIY
jgi:tetratricopeptide (TPR) repeat protein